MVPTVSVVIPAYNNEATIGPTIESVLRQTFNDLEIIVADDGSKDETGEAVRKFKERVRYIRQEHVGASAARNLGFSLVESPYVAFLDADDLWLPEKLQLQMESLKSHPQVDAVQCSVYRVDNQLKVVGANLCSPAQDTLLDFLLFRNLPGLASTLLARTDSVRALGGFATDLIILEDWDLVCRLARNGSLRSMPECLVLYRQYPGNRSRHVSVHIEPGFRSLNRLFSDPHLDPGIRKREPMIRARFFAMLAGGYAKNREWGSFFYWAWRSFQTAPRGSGTLAGLALKRLRRKARSYPIDSFASQMPFGILQS